jgi:hypothetical protein
VIEPAIIFAAAFSALATVLVIRWVAPPRPRLAGRVRPYGANRIVGAAIDPQVPVGSALKTLARFALAPLARRIGRLVDRDGGLSAGLRLRQAGLYPAIDDQQAVEAFRIRQLEIGFGYLVGAVVLSISLELTSSRALTLCLLAAVVAAARQRGAIDRAIRGRQDLMRIEIYTVISCWRCG